VRKVLTISRMTKAFPGTLALNSVDMDVAAGEVHALVGQNGSGKSTLIKVLAGFHAPEAGTAVEVDGKPVHLNDAAASRRAGFRFVHQDLGLVQDLSMLENLALGRRYARGFAGRIRWRDERRKAQALVESLGYEFDVRDPVSTLGAAERTGVAIARALQDADAARILVLDEPTATLPKPEVEGLFSVIRRIRERDMGVVYVSHRLDEIFAIADRVTVLRDGRRVGTYPVAELDQDRLIDLMTGGAPVKVDKPARAAGLDTVLDVRSLAGKVVDDASFSARAGEVLGVAGLTGSGREELLQLLFGAQPGSGQMTVGGHTLALSDIDPRAAMKAGVALVPADRHRKGGVLRMSLKENCTLTDLRRHRRLGALRHRSERAEVEHWLAALDVRPPVASLALDSLSGGNQQKIVISKWLRLKPRVLLLDEPTQGVDVGAKASIHALLRQAADDGAAVVIASSDDEEIADTCDRALVLNDGRIVGELAGDALSIEALGRMQLTGRAATAA
jgi:ribose transport system ATP-binding protein